MYTSFMVHELLFNLIVDLFMLVPAPPYLRTFVFTCYECLNFYKSAVLISSSFFNDSGVSKTDTLK